MAKTTESLYIFYKSLKDCLRLFHLVSKPWLGQNAAIIGSNFEW
jgi:hypothetical protein